MMSQQKMVNREKGARRKLVKHKQYRGDVGLIRPGEKGTVPDKKGDVKTTASSSFGLRLYVCIDNSKSEWPKRKLSR